VLPNRRRHVRQTPAPRIRLQAFLDHHAETEIVPALQELALLVCLRMAGGRPVIVRSQMIEIEKGTRRTADPFL
jgi:hypothetical protein